MLVELEITEESWVTISVESYKSVCSKLQESTLEIAHCSVKLYWGWESRVLI